MSEGSTWHAQGVVVKAKTWKLAVAVLCAVQVLTAAVPGPVAHLDARLCMIDGDEADDDMQGDAEVETRHRPPAGVGPFLSMYRAGIAHAWVHSCYLPVDLNVMEPGDRSMRGARESCDILRNEYLSACARVAQPQYAQ